MESRDWNSLIYMINIGVISQIIAASKLKTTVSSGGSVSLCNPVAGVVWDGANVDSSGVSDVKYYSGTIWGTNDTSRSLCSVEMKLSRAAGDISGFVYTASVWSLNGNNLSGSIPLAQSYVNGSNSWSSTWVQFPSFSTPVPVTSGSSYAIMISHGGIDASNYINIFWDTSAGNGYKSGYSDGTIANQAVPNYAVSTKLHFISEGGSSLSPPAWGDELNRTTEIGGGATTGITSNVGVSQNARVVVMAVWSGGQSIGSITDSRGNTYTQSVVQTDSNVTSYAIWSSKISTAIQSSDSITVNWNSPSYSYRSLLVCYITGTTSTDVSGWNNVYGSTVAASGTTTAPNVSVGMVWALPAYTPSWTAIGSPISHGGDANSLTMVRKTNAAAGTLDIGGTVSSATVYSTLWADFI